ncbi:unnamed protein product, partial [Gongylonema pulchrum]|uniref:Ovule protein n=1 Tax=Gongylonema pulchrum TaxID=637853 RepID=A0A183DW09_9BILA
FSFEPKNQTPQKGAFCYLTAGYASKAGPCRLDLLNCQPPKKLIKFYIFCCCSKASLAPEAKRAACLSSQILRRHNAASQRSLR